MKQIVTRRATRPKRVRRTQKTGQRPGRRDDRATVDTPNDAPTMLEPSRRIRVLTETELRNVPAPVWDIERRIPRGGVTIIVGPPGYHKTRVVAAASGALAAGGNWYGAKATRQGPILSVVLEDVSGWSARWFAWRNDAGVDDGEKLRLHTIPDNVNLFTGEGFEALMCEVQRLSPIAIVLDTISDLSTGADENSQKDMGIVRSRLKQLTCGGVRTVIAVHHTGHNHDRERGSSVLRAMADAMILMKADGDEVLMTCLKQRNGAKFPDVRLQFDPTALVLRNRRVTTFSDRLPKAQQTLLDVLKAMFADAPGGVSVKDWQVRSRDAEGIPYRTFYDAKKKLMTANLVEEVANACFRPA